MRWLRSAILVLATGLLVYAGSVCGPALAQTARPFRLGFTPFPYAVTFPAVDYTYEAIAGEADLIAHHFDDGVPWPEAFAETAFNPALTAEWLTRKQRTPPDHVVYLSIMPVNFWRNALAAYRGAKGDLPLPAPWDTLPLDHPDVKAAFLNYAHRAIAHYAPDYLNIGIEVNLILENAPALWPAYLELHKATYTALKADYPDLPIFVSVVALHMIDGATKADHAAHRRAFAEIAPYTDLFALSIYPYMADYMTGPLPADLFDQLRALSDKPMAIAETGYPAETLWITVNDTPFPLPSDPQKQAEYIALVLDAAQKHRFEFVINFVLRDYDQMWRDFGAPDDPIWLAWRDTGLFDGEGNARPALDVWRAALQRPFGR